MKFRRLLIFLFGIELVIAVLSPISANAASSQQGPVTLPLQRVGQELVRRRRGERVHVVRPPTVDRNVDRLGRVALRGHHDERSDHPVYGRGNARSGAAGHRQPALRDLAPIPGARRRLHGT